MEALAVFLKLGLASFGDPVAHIGYFRREFVKRWRWPDDATFIDLVGLCQFLPGPANNQVEFSIGLPRAGWRGGLTAWCDFTLLSVLLLLAFAMLAPSLGGPFGAGLIHGLKPVAVAAVVQVVWNMARKPCPDWRRAGIAVLSIAVLGALTIVYAQLVMIALGVTLGLVLCQTSLPASGSQRAGQGAAFSMSHVASIVSLALFCVLLFGLPVLTDLRLWMPIKVFDAFYRSGALVFGGGHIVLPLLEQQTVATGWMASSDFLAGCGTAQAVPGPLFIFAAFLDWTIGPGLNHWAGTALAAMGIFLPGQASFSCKIWRFRLSFPCGSVAWKFSDFATVVLFVRNLVVSYCRPRQT